MSSGCPDEFLGTHPTLRPILLIDDNPLQLKVRETILRQAGFPVSIATRAESAFAALRAVPERVGLIITDHLMPGWTGSELVRRIRAAGIQVPIVVLSGLQEAELEYQGLDVVFRVKPFPPEELIELAHSLLEANGQERGAA
jgi:DNA-binding response OmpR family regulator